jgi:hypothetical protein
MASNKRKKTFPKPPQRFHSKLAHELGKWSNKNGFEASLKGIYFQDKKDNSPKLDERQAKQLQKLKDNLKKRGNNAINYDW